MFTCLQKYYVFAKEYNPVGLTVAFEAGATISADSIAVLPKTRRPDQIIELRSLIGFNDLSRIVEWPFLL